MTEKKLNTETNDIKKKNPMPFLIGALAVCLIAGIYYLTSGSRQPEPANTSAAPTPTPTYKVVLPEKKEKTKLSVEQVEETLKPASDLITSRYYYTNAASFDSVLTWFGGIDNPFTHSKGYITYDGIVSVGINLNDITFDIDDEQQVITIHLPKEGILAHEIDNSTVITDAKESIFNNLDAEYYAKLIDGLKKDTEKKVTGNSAYMTQVRKNTEQVLKNFLSASELTREYTVRFAD